MRPVKNERGASKELYQADSEILKKSNELYIYIGELDSLVNQLYEMHAGLKIFLKPL